MLNFCDFIQVYVFTSNHHLNASESYITFPTEKFRPETLPGKSVGKATPVW